MAHINPSYHSKNRKEKSATQYAEGIINGDRYALSEIITISESMTRAKQDLAAEVFEILSQKENIPSIRIAVSGAPGVGKSTLIEEWGLHIIEHGHRVAVLAIDPSSSVTHGSILGDKTRMHKLSAHPSAFVRPSAAGDTLGGVHHSTRESMQLCEYAGYDVILVETVGVGQSEIIAASMTDIFLLLLLPGAGDDLQGIKRGIVELADIVAVNKSDQDRRSIATQSAKSYRNALSLFQHPLSQWKVPVSLVSGLHGEGLGILWDQVNKYVKLSKQSNYLEKKRTTQDAQWLDAAVAHEIQLILKNNIGLQHKIKEAKNEILSQGRSTHTIINEIKSVIRNTYKA